MRRSAVDGNPAESRDIAAPVDIAAAMTAMLEHNQVMLPHF
jgi:hypothetical protein